MNKKYIFIAAVAVGMALGQAALAANAVVSFSPSAGSHQVGDTFNVSVQADPQGNQVCVVKGSLQFTGLTCQSVSVASGLIAQTSPTCQSPAFSIGIPKCASSIQQLMTVSVKTDAAGQGQVSVVSPSIIGAGVAVSATVNAAVYAVAAPTPAPTPASTQSTSPTGSSGTSSKKTTTSTGTKTAPTSTSAGAATNKVTVPAEESQESATQQQTEGEQGTATQGTPSVTPGSQTAAAAQSNFPWTNWIWIALIVAVVAYFGWRLYNKRKMSK